MAGRPKIGSEVDVANKLSRKKIAQTLRSDQAQASSFFSRGTGCSGRLPRNLNSHSKLCLAQHVVAAISDVVGVNSVGAGATKAQASVTKSTKTTAIVVNSASKTATISASAAEAAETARAGAVKSAEKPASSATTVSDVIGVDSAPTVMTRATSSNATAATEMLAAITASTTAAPASTTTTGKKRQHQQ